MLDRIRRKLFLSVKIMGSKSRGSDNSEEQNIALKANELMAILRKGSSAISRAEGDGLSLSRFLDASIHDIVQTSKSTDDMRSLKMQKDVCGDVQREDEQKLLYDAEEEEKRLLSGVAQVQSRLFEGKVVVGAKSGTNRDIAVEWEKLQKRARQTRIVVIDGYEVLAKHLGAVAVSEKQLCTTIESDKAQSTNSRPAKPPQKKNKKRHDWEDWCVYCRDGGELALCSSCPRGVIVFLVSFMIEHALMSRYLPVFHPACHGITDAHVKAMPMIYCPQHHCVECNRNTADAGGMLFR
jgi:SWI/SNF-related matrix-associated actin-dependent regulator of chromatin subfamily A member 5